MAFEDAVRSRAAVLWPARGALLAGPTVLAFFTGGYFNTTQTWAGVCVWAGVLVAALLDPEGLRLSRPAWVAILGLLGWAAWSLLSMTWAPLAGSAYHAGQLVLLYAGALLAATILLRDPDAARPVVAALALGAAIVVGYGVSGRLLPGVLHFARSAAANGRLEQPLTYWNGMGELAALGLVLSARLIGQRDQPHWLRAGAAIASVPLGAGLYLSFSRGALFAWIAGLIALGVTEPRREQWRGLALGTGAGVAAAVACAPFRGITGMAGTLPTREQQGAIVLGLLVVVALVAAALGWRHAEHPTLRAVRLPRGAGWAATVAICIGLAIAIAAGAHEGTGRPLGGGAGRLTTFESNRYAYWAVALDAFSAHPLNGVGAGNWSVWWLSHRTVDEFVQDAHSLPLQTAAELGLVGLALLGAVVGGLAFAARRVRRWAASDAAGPIAGLVCFAAHQPLDWDWQLPALTLVAILLAGLLLGAATGNAGAAPASERFGDPRRLTAEDPHGERADHDRRGQRDRHLGQTT